MVTMYLKLKPSGDGLKVRFCKIFSTWKESKRIAQMKVYSFTWQIPTGYHINKTFQPSFTKKDWCQSSNSKLDHKIEGNYLKYRSVVPVVPVVPGGAMAPQYFGRSVNPISKIMPTK